MYGDKFKLKEIFFNTLGEVSVKEIVSNKKMISTSEKVAWLLQYKDGYETTM
jgi:hypothetical protein